MSAEKTWVTMLWSQCAIGRPAVIAIAEDGLVENYPAVWEEQKREAMQATREFFDADFGPWRFWTAQAQVDVPGGPGECESCGGPEGLERTGDGAVCDGCVAAHEAATQRQNGDSA